MALRQPPAEHRKTDLEAGHELATRGVAHLVDESRTIREQMRAFQTRYAHRGSHAPLSPATLSEIREGTKHYLDLQHALADATARTEPFADAGTPLAAAAALYDNHIAMLPLLADTHFRRLVNYPDLGYGIGKDELWNLVLHLSSRHSRYQLRHLVERWQGTASEAADPQFAEAIAASTTVQHVEDATLDQVLPTAALVRRLRAVDGLAELGDSAMYAVSEAFGNAIGSVEMRKGKLWQREDVLRHLHRVLRPLDLLLEKTPFRLTDYFIPGHFGHVAIWMGKAKEIRRLGVWKDEAMREERLQACRPLIEEGRGVLEALRPGVELNALRVFANVDDLAVLRPTRMKRKEKRESLIRGFHQVGKEYDFNFDVETTGTIVCSELPYHVYPGVEWTTEEQLGRFTISPDNVALEALGGNADFELIAFYHDGALVPQQDALRTMQTLMEQG